MKARSLLAIADTSPQQIERILNLAQNFREVADRPIKKVPSLRGRLIITLFYEPSTRTSSSFELAAKRLSADVLNLKASGSSVEKGETLKDTALTLDAYHPDLLVIRHPYAGAAATVARHIRAGVVNAGDGKHEHPTQCLLDLFTLKQVYGELAGLKVCFVGDLLHSRVARSGLIGFQKMGITVSVVAPPPLLPRDLADMGIETHTELEAARRADVVYVLRLQSERFNSQGYLQGLSSYKNYRVTQGFLGKDQYVMHPGPINRGVEVSARAADGPRSLILQQVENGVAVRMAVLYDLLVESQEQRLPSSESSLQTVRGGA